MTKNDLSLIGKIFYYTGTLKLTTSKHNNFYYRILNPLGLIFMIVYVITFPFVCLFTTQKIQTMFAHVNLKHFKLL